MRALLASAIVTCLVGLAAPARGEGLLSMRGGYFKERSTLVEQPMIDLELDSGRHGWLDAHVLVDGITSASSATGGSREFTERRYEIGLGYTWAWSRVRAGARAHYSLEQDYMSAVGSAHAEMDLAQKNALVRLS